MAKEFRYLISLHSCSLLVTKQNVCSILFWHWFEKDIVFQRGIAVQDDITVECKDFSSQDCNGKTKKQIKRSVCYWITSYFHSKSLTYSCSCQPQLTVFPVQFFSLLISTSKDVKKENIVKGKYLKSCIR